MVLGPLPLRSIYLGDVWREGSLIVWTLLPHHPYCLCASTGSSQLWHPAPASSPTLSSLFACSLLLPQVAVSPAGEIAPNLTSFSAYFVPLLCLNHSLSTTIEAYPVCLSLITLCQTGSRGMIGMPNCVAAVWFMEKSPLLNFHWDKAIKVVMHCMDRPVSHSLHAVLVSGIPRRARQCSIVVGYLSLKHHQFLPGCLYSDVWGNDVCVICCYINK